jgi:hypothetical protein
MNIIIIIEYLAIIIISLYIIGIIVVWVCDFKMNIVYRKMQKHFVKLGDLNLSMAVLHAKKYKIMADYRRDILMIEKVQKFILENLLLIKRCTLKN